ncbi:MAG: hypothetical protein FD174_3339 [Geobacteraceae bacterium]|nr:MAG: hypothetical protein FD174_3339 [Geobacteraceae bacterium]
MKRIQRNPDVMWREEDEAKAQAYEGLEQGADVEDMGTSLLFSDGMMVSLNILGTEVWKLCDGRSVDEILSELILQFDVEADVLKADVMSFLSELAEKGFIRYEE